MNKKSRLLMSLVMMSIMACNNTVTQNTTDTKVKKNGYDMNYSIKSDCYYGDCYGSPDPYYSSTPEPTFRPIPTAEPDPTDYNTAKYLDAYKSDSDTKNTEINGRVALTRKKIDWLRNMYLTKIPSQFSSKSGSGLLNSIDSLSSQLSSVTYAQGCRSYYSFRSEPKKKNPCKDQQQSDPNSPPTNPQENPPEEGQIYPSQLGILAPSSGSGFGTYATNTSSIKDDILELKPVIDNINRLYKEVSESYNNQNLTQEQRNLLINSKYDEINTLRQSSTYKNVSQTFDSKLNRLSNRSSEIINNANTLSDNYFDDSNFIKVPKDLKEFKDNIYLSKRYIDDDFTSTENTYDLINAMRVISLQYKTLADLSYGYIDGIITDLDQTQVDQEIDPDYPIFAMYKVTDVITYLENQIKTNESQIKSINLKLTQEVNEINLSLESVRNELYEISISLDQTQISIDEDKDKIDTLLNQFNIKITPIPEQSITPGYEADRADVEAARVDSMIGQLQTMIGGASVILSGSIPNGGGGLKGELDKIADEINELNKLPKTPAIESKLTEKRSQFGDVNTKIQEMEGLKKKKTDILDKLVERTAPKVQVVKNTAKVQKAKLKNKCSNGGCDLKFGNPKSVPTYGHTFTGKKNHSAKNSDTIMYKNASKENVSQGRWGNDELAAKMLDKDLLNSLPKGNVKQTPRDLPSGVTGQVFRPDGTKANADSFVAVPNVKGGYTTAYSTIRNEFK